LERCVPICMPLHMLFCTPSLPATVFFPFIEPLTPPLVKEFPSWTGQRRLFFVRCWCVSPPFPRLYFFFLGNFQSYLSFFQNRMFPVNATPFKSRVVPQSQPLRFLCSFARLHLLREFFSFPISSRPFPKFHHPTITKFFPDLFQVLTDSPQLQRSSHAPPYYLVLQPS